MTNVLVLEEEPSLMELVRRVLKRYTVLAAYTAEQALWQYKNNSRGLGLLIADVALPTSSGIQVALILRLEDPALPVILTSGYPVGNWNGRDTADFGRLRSDPVIVLQRPFEAQRLLSCARELIRELPEVARTA